MTEIAESRAFKPQDDATTTWISHGLTETTLEELLDLPTHAPVDGHNATMNGGYELGRIAQMMGRKAAREYALHSGENTGDTAQIAQKRQAARLKVQELLRSS